MGGGGGGGDYGCVSKSALMRAPPRGGWGRAPLENFLNSRSSEMGSSAISVS